MEGMRRREEPTSRAERGSGASQRPREESAPEGKTCSLTQRWPGGQTSESYQLDLAKGAFHDLVTIVLVEWCVHAEQQNCSGGKGAGEEERPSGGGRGTLEWGVVGGEGGLSSFSRLSCLSFHSLSLYTFLSPTLLSLLWVERPKHAQILMKKDTEDIGKRFPKLSPAAQIDGFLIYPIKCQSHSSIWRSLGAPSSTCLKLISFLPVCRYFYPLDWHLIRAPSQRPMGHPGFHLPQPPVLP